MDEPPKSEQTLSASKFGVPLNSMVSATTVVQSLVPSEPVAVPDINNFAGFVVVGDRSPNVATNPHLMRGTAMGGYNGHIYLPDAKLLMPLPAISR